jgi:hypothetical protein
MFVLAQWQDQGFSKCAVRDIDVIDAVRFTAPKQLSTRHLAHCR